MVPDVHSFGFEGLFQVRVGIQARWKPGLGKVGKCAPISGRCPFSLSSNSWNEKDITGGRANWGKDASRRPGVPIAAGHVGYMAVVRDPKVIGGI